jgi:hypothetical protein
METAAGDWRRTDGSDQLDLEAEIAGVVPIRDERRAVAKA